MRSRVLMTAEVAALVQREVGGGAVHGVLGNTGVPQWSETLVAATSPTPAARWAAGTGSRVCVQTAGDVSVVFDELRETGMRSPPAAERG
jgi:hypothetical protein